MEKDAKSPGYRTYFIYCQLKLDTNLVLLVQLKRIIQIISLSEIFLYNYEFHHFLSIQLFNRSFFDMQCSFLLIPDKHIFTMLFKYQFTLKSFYWLHSTPFRQLYFSRSDSVFCLFPKATGRTTYYQHVEYSSHCET